MKRIAKSESFKWKESERVMFVHILLAFSFVVACVVSYGAAVPLVYDDNLF